MQHTHKLRRKEGPDDSQSNNQETDCRGNSRNSCVRQRLVSIVELVATGGDPTMEWQVKEECMYPGTGNARDKVCKKGGEREGIIEAEKKNNGASRLVSAVGRAVIPLLSLLSGMCLLMLLSQV